MSGEIVKHMYQRATIGTNTIIICHVLSFPTPSHLGPASAHSADALAHWANVLAQRPNHLALFFGPAQWAERWPIGPICVEFFSTHPLEIIQNNKAYSVYLLPDRCVAGEF